MRWLAFNPPPLLLSTPSTRQASRSQQNAFGAVDRLLDRGYDAKRLKAFPSLTNDFSALRMVLQN